MSIPPEKIREAVLLILFAMQNEPQSDEGLISSLMHQLKMARSKVKEALTRAYSIYEKSPQLIHELEKICEHYRWSRLGRVEQTVLVLASWELKFMQPPLPFKIVLSEAARLAKKFSGLESAKFVNAVLQTFHEGRPLATELNWQDPQVDMIQTDLKQGAQLEVGHESEMMTE